MQKDGQLLKCKNRPVCRSWWVRGVNSPTGDHEVTRSLVADNTDVPPLILDAPSRVPFGSECTSKNCAVLPVLD